MLSFKFIIVCICIDTIKYIIVVFDLDDRYNNKK